MSLIGHCRYINKLEVNSPSLVFEVSSMQDNRLQRDFMQKESQQNSSIKDKVELRPYEWTFRQPIQVPIDYTNLRELAQKVKQTEQLLKIDNKIQISTELNFLQTRVQRKQQKTEKESQQQKQQLPYFRVSQKIQAQQLWQAQMQDIVNEQMVKFPTKRNSKMMTVDNSKDKQFVVLNLEMPNVYECDVFLQTEEFQYRPDIAGVCGTPYLIFTTLKLGLSDITKIKIFPSVAKGRSFKIKIEHCKKNYFMGVQLKRQLYNLPEHYIWLAKITNSRLMRDKLLHEVIMNSNKANSNQQGPSDGSFIQGEIFKKSKYKKKWDKRYVVINTEGLFSYRNRNQNYTFIIASKDLEQLWTRFERHEGRLIIKILHAGTKTQFAIPIMDYCLKNSQNWLFAFYRLLMEHKIHIKTV